MEGTDLSMHGRSREAKGLQAYTTVAIYAFGVYLSRLLVAKLAAPCGVMHHIDLVPNFVRDLDY